MIEAFSQVAAIVAEISRQRLERGCLIETEENELRSSDGMMMGAIDNIIGTGNA